MERQRIEQGTNDPKRLEEGYTPEGRTDRARSDASRDSSMKLRDWLAIVIMPSLIGVAAVVLAVVLQDRSFRGNQLFSLKLSQINAGHEAAVDTLRDVDRAIRQIRADEAWVRDQLANPEAGLQHDIESYRNGEYFAASIDALKDSKVRVDALVASSEATGAGNAVAAAAETYTAKLGAFVKCLQDNKQFQCAETNGEVIPALRSIVVAHTTAANQLIVQSK